MLTVAIDDYPWKSVALAPDDPAKLRIDPAAGAVFGRLRDAPLKKVQIEILSPP